MAEPEDESTFWPKWVGEDTGCPVWLLGYEAAASGWNADAMALRHQGSAVIERLCVNDNIAGPLVLVGHSLGGLVIKAAIEHGMHSGVSYQKECVERIKGVAFVGTPHFGSALASLLGWFRLFRANPQVHDLRVNDANLEALNNTFLNYQRQLGIRAIVFREMRPVRAGRWCRLLPGALVVSPSSANAHIPDAAVVNLEQDHISMCKPRNREADIHMSLVAFIKRVNRDAAAPELRSAGERQSSQGYGSQLPEEHEPKPVYLALATSGLGFANQSNGAIVTVALLVTDAAEALRQQLIELRKSISQDALATVQTRDVAQHGSLRDMAEHPGTRTRFLDQLAVIPFSAYIYYAGSPSLDMLPPEQRTDLLLVEPLVQRLSKRSEHVVRIITTRSDVQQLLSEAAGRIRTRFGRIVSKPSLGNGRYHEFEQLASLLATSAAGHLTLPRNPEQTAIFQHFRTRIRFAENVATGEAHRRDVNPLP